MACGKDVFLRERNRQVVVALTKSGVRHEWRQTEGDHSWPVWRGYLAGFVPRLFAVPQATAPRGREIPRAGGLPRTGAAAHIPACNAASYAASISSKSADIPT
jgi:hypothetical protein